MIGSSDLNAVAEGEADAAVVNGQFRTPRHIIRMIVDLMQPRADDLICEKTLPTLMQTNGTKKSTQMPKGRNTKWHPDTRGSGSRMPCFFLMPGFISALP